MSPTDALEEEIEEKPVTLTAVIKEEEVALLHHSDNLPKILRLTVYLLRFRNRLRAKTFALTTALPTSEETDFALQALVRWTQHVFFADDIKQLDQDRPCSMKLRKLAPFLDKHGLLRVGGRLANAKMPYNEKYPLLLPKCSRLTALLIDHVHRTQSHPGPQTLQNILCQDYWILSARSIIRKMTHKCIPCFRVKPRVSQPVMGNLPPHRLAQIKPFSKVGVDFAGPFDVKAAMLRKVKVTKAYICVFVCMVTTAIHIELVSDLSTPLFIAALDRFISRRGRCSDIYSDCGTNFVGTQRYLKEIDAIIRQPNYAQHVVENQIKWHFNPPAAPHMGGLWEAAVKSVKTLLHRIIMDRVLTYEELNTVLHHVEATLNSRPLSAMSSDPSDFKTLTAGHFLTMEPLVTIPAPKEPDQSTVTSLRKRWSLVQQIQHHFWSRWQKEYLHTLQERPKWTRVTPNLQIGDLVIVKEPTPPLTWRTARVIEVHPGMDGVVRVAKIQTATGKVLTRPAVKLCPMPLHD